MAALNNSILLTHLFPTEKTNALIKSKYPNAIEIIVSKTGNENYCVKATTKEMYMEIVSLWDNLVCEYIKGDTPCRFYLDCDLKSNRLYGVSYNGKSDTSKSIIDEEIKRNSFLRNYKYIYKIRETRLIEDGVYKHSYHIVFPDLIVENNGEIKNYLLSIGYNKTDKNIWDLIPYDAGRKMSALYCTKSKDVPIFEPIAYAKTTLDLNDYFITNVGDSDVITKLPHQTEKKKTEEPEAPKKEYTKKTESATDKSFIEEKIKRIIDKLKSDRSDDYETWTNVLWALIGIGKKEELKRRFVEDMAHLFSKKSKKYDDGAVDDLFDKGWNRNAIHTLGWPYFMNCLKEDDIDYYEKINTQTYASYKKEFELKNCKILEPPSIITIDREGTVIVNKIKDFKAREQHTQVIVKNKKEEWETKQFADMWLTDKTIRKYDKIVFSPPPIITKSYDFNTWEDFKIKEVVNTPTANDLVKGSLTQYRDYYAEYCEYAKNLIGEEHLAMFVLSRYAYRLQNPAYKTQLCLIIYGSEGDGKNMLLTPIYKIFGKSASSIDDAEKLYDKHCELENQRLFILVNETGGDANFKKADVLKSRITDPELWINPKGTKAYCVANRCDYDMTTNNKNVVKLSLTSHRRFLQIETTQYYSGNTEFFNDFLKNIVNNENALKQIYDGLMKLDVTKYVPSGNFQTDKPETDIMGEVKEQNKDKVLLFIEDIVKEYEGQKTEIIYTNMELFDKWNYWAHLNKVKIEYNKYQFGIKFSDMCKKFINKGEERITKNLKKSTTTFKYDLLKKYLDID
jgi:hypothetical protein